MTFNSNLNSFNGLSIEDFDIKKGIQNPKVANRVKLDWDRYEAGESMANMLEIFCDDPRSKEIHTLVIGAWDFESSVMASEVITVLCENAGELPQLKSLMLGDITYEEMEVSWIEQGEQEGIFKAFPLLETYQVRGGNGLSFSNLKHPNLKKLIIETGGLSKNILADIAQAELPKLEHLELWLGSNYYGFNASMEDIRQAYTGKLISGNHFPQLKYLGLRNSEIADTIAEGLKDDPILDQIETLDLSKGNLSDKGAEALCANPQIKKLKALYLHHNYISDAWQDKLSELGIPVDISNSMSASDPEDRYIAVSE